MTPLLCIVFHHYEVSTVAGRPILFCRHCGDAMPLNPYKDKPKKEGDE